MIFDHERIQLDEGIFITVVRFRTPHVAATAEIEEMGQSLYHLVEGESPKLVLDFSTVVFFSSAALGKLISLLSRVRARQGTLILCGIRPGLLDVFHTCHLDRIFQIRSNVDDALAAWSRSES
jgi:anti-anti-sigma factor